MFFNFLSFFDLIYIFNFTSFKEHTMEDQTQVLQSMVKATTKAVGVRGNHDKGDLSPGAFLIHGAVDRAADTGLPS